MIKKKQKRILAVSHFSVADNRAGGEIMFHELLKQLVKDGYLVDMVATCNTGPVVEVDGITIYRGEEYRDKERKGYDLVISQFAEADVLAPKLLKEKIPFVYVVHNTNDGTHALLENFKPDLTVFNTNWVKEYHKYQGNSIIVHPPVYREAHATERGTKVTLINLMPAKGSNMFYNMAFRLPRVQFLGVQGGYFQNGQQYIRRPNIEFQKNTNDMKRDVWSKTKILLMPSTYESYGMTAIEACASGIPVVACPTPGLQESLSYAGIFPKNTGIVEWRTVINRLMLDEKYYQECSEKCLKRSLELDPRPELEAFSKAIGELLNVK